MTTDERIENRKTRLLLAAAILFRRSETGSFTNAMREAVELEAELPKGVNSGS